MIGVTHCLKLPMIGVTHWSHTLIGVTHCLKLFKIANDWSHTLFKIANDWSHTLESHIDWSHTLFKIANDWSHTLGGIKYQKQQPLCQHFQSPRCSLSLIHIAGT